MKTRKLLMILLITSSLVAPIFAASVAANGIGYIEFLPEEKEVEPGESFQMTVDAASYPQSHVGAAESYAEISFNSEFLEISEMNEPDQGWLEGGEETTVETTAWEVDNEEGVARVGKVRDPWRGGVEGNATFVEITFHVKNNTPIDTELMLNITSSEMLLTDAMYQKVLTNQATIYVTNSSSEVASPSDPEQTDQPTDVEPTESPPANPGNSEPSPDGQGTDTLREVLYGVIATTLILTGALLLYARRNG